MSRLIAATIHAGAAVADDLAALPEGTAVSVLAPGDEDDVPTTAQLDDLDAAHEEADRGELVAAEDVLGRLDARRASASAPAPR